MPSKVIFRRPFPGRPALGNKAGFEGKRDVPVAPPAVLVAGGKSVQVHQSSSGLALLEIKATVKHSRGTVGGARSVSRRAGAADTARGTRTATKRDGVK